MGKWQKGESGNPGGRKVDKPFRDALMLAIHECEGDVKKLRKVAEALVAKASSGDVSAIREIGDRLDGKPAQAIVGEEDKPLRQIIEVTKFIAASKPEAEND